MSNNPTKLRTFLNYQKIFMRKLFVFYIFVPKIKCMSKFVQFIRTNPVLRFLQNKYILVIIVAFFWLTFLDKYSIVSQIKMGKTIERLKADKQFYIQGAEDTDYEIEKLTTDPAELEKYAREKYWLKRNNEDLFIIVDE